MRQAHRIVLDRPSAVQNTEIVASGNSSKILEGRQILTDNVFLVGREGGRSLQTEVTEIDRLLQTLTKKLA